MTSGRGEISQVKGRASAFFEDFERAYPEFAASAAFRRIAAKAATSGWYVETRHLLTEARLRSVETSLSAARQAVAEHPTQVLLTTLSELAELVLDGVVTRTSPDAGDVKATMKTLTREIADVLVTFARQQQPLREQALARAAIINARAEDRTLAKARLDEWQRLPSRPDDLLYSLRTSVLVGLAADALHSQEHRDVAWTEVHSCLEQMTRPAAEAMRGAEQASKDAICGAYSVFLCGLTSTDEVARLVEQILFRWQGFTHAAPQAAFYSITEAICLPPRMQRSSFDEAARLAYEAEELAWLIAPEQRGLAWSRLAMCWARIGRGADAVRAVDRALTDARAAQRPEADLDDLFMLANVLDVKVATSHHSSSVRASSGQQTEASPHADEPLVSPELRGRLLESLASGIVLVAGPDLPPVAGRPRRSEAMEVLLDDALGDKMADLAHRLKREIRAGNSDLAAGLMAEGSARRVAELYDAPVIGEAYDVLARLHFTSVITMGWDSQLLSSFKYRDPKVIRPDRSVEVLLGSDLGDFSFLWLYGEPSTGSVSLTWRDVRQAVYNVDVLGRLLSGLAQSNSFLFLGCRPSDIEQFLDLSPSSVRSATEARGATRHLGFVERDDLFDLQKAQFARELGVELVGYDARDPSALARIIAELGSSAQLATSPGDDPRGALLSRVVLRNIGLFEHVDLTLTAGWNLLLGNNGCGKSTLLRAVALGLCGDHPRAGESGEALLRVGADHGLIELTVASSVFTTELRRSGGVVRVVSTSLTPLQQGSLTVFGFPALRGLTTLEPQGISQSQSTKPHVNDVLPLVLGGVDRRVDDIKQWIVNAAARSSKTGAANSSLDRFFNVVAELTPGRTLRFESVDQTSWEVLVRSDEVVVPIDQLSQGMNSILVWAGTLLQRLQDIHIDETDPTEKPAVVLIDEIDAHLHPAWQRLVPSLARRHFPNVQFLVTSHSPLVAGALRPEEVFVVDRAQRGGPSENDRSRGTVVQSNFDTEGLRADQILTSPLFGLRTSRDPTVEQAVGRFSDLIGRHPRTSDEEQEFAELESQVSRWMLLGETVSERQHEAQSQAIADRRLEEAVNELGADDAKMLKRRLEELIPDDGER